MKWFKHMFVVFLFIIPYDVNAETQWTWPVSGVISDYFGTRSGHHYGIDIAASVGTSVVAASDGLVTKSYYSNSYGNVIFIRHTNGYEAVYAHLNKRFVKEGERIHSMQKIGEVGNTGFSHGSHLHFEVHKGAWNISKSNAVNPLQMLATAPAEVASSSSYLVQKGDTLQRIAKKFGTTVQQIKKKNNLHKDRIYPSQHLFIN